MSEENTTQEAASSESAVEESQDQEISSQESQSTDDVVPKAELQKVLDDMMKFKKQAKEYEAKIKEAEMNKLREKEEWEKIAKIKEEEATEYLQKYETLNKALYDQKRYDAIKQAALQNGIRKEALEDLELYDFTRDVAIETTSTGKINVLGAESAVKKLKSQRPHWFGKSMNSLNTNSPEAVSGEGVTLEKINEARAKARQSGDWKAVEKLMKAYQAQA